MEYTARLAGECSTDEPRCVDEELAAILRGADDELSNVDQPLLVPLLGRAIGLAVEPPPPGAGVHRRAGIRRRREMAAPYQERTARLRREATRRFSAALGPSFLPTTRAGPGAAERSPGCSGRP